MIAARAESTSGQAWLWAMVIVLVLVAGLALQLVPAVEVQVAPHAFTRHGDDAGRALQCLDGRPSQVFINPLTSRQAVVCWLEDRWGIVILSATLTVITAFVCKKLRDNAHVHKYMNRQGYR